MIAASPSPPVAYLWEPFSMLHRPGILDVRFEHWFPYVCLDNQDPYIDPIAQMLDLRYQSRAELLAVRSPKDLGRLLRDRSRFHAWRRAGARPLLKDPIAVMSASWLADTFDMEVVMLIRHPAAFVNSVKLRVLHHPFTHFLAQPLLLRDLLADFEDEVRAFASAERPLLEQGILLWRMIHHVILGFRDRYPSWSFIRLEDLATDPLKRFEDLYARLGQTMTEESRATIVAHSAESNPPEQRDPVSLRRHSLASISTWKNHLSDPEISTIRAAVEPIAKAFYGDEDW